jgi:hypothetical protein
MLAFGVIMNLDQYVWKCSCCDKDMNGLPPAIDFKAPDHWLLLDAQTKKKSKISDDFCFIKEPDGKTFRYIRCVMEMPLAYDQEGDAQFDFGVWMAVSEHSWNTYWKGFRSGRFAVDTCEGQLSNAISIYPDSLNLSAEIYFQHAYQRPLIQLHDCGHALVVAQKTGMKIDSVESLAAKWMH